MRPRATAFGLVAGAVLGLLAAGAPAGAAEEPPHPAELDAMIVRAAQRHGVPEHLLRRIVMRESKYNPHARNHRYWGLMQISYPTAKSMGFRGSPEELLNPLTNLRYAVPYLANAFIAAGKREDAAVRLYASGYYDTARRRGILGLLRNADSAPVVDAPEPGEAALASAPASDGIFGSLFGSSAQPDAAVSIASYPGANYPGTQVATPAQAAPPADAAPPARDAAAALPQGRRTTGGVDLATDRSGRSRPPGKWLHDGGLTILARGEQGRDSFAAARVAQGEAGHAASGRARKSAMFASLDAPGQPPASAQAYAASASDETPGPQAAIAQALSAQSGAQAPEALDRRDKPHRRHTAQHRGRHGAEHSETSKANAALDAADGGPIAQR